MKMRARRRRWKPMFLRGPFHGSWRQRVLGKCVILRVVADVGHDEHNCWDEFLIARYK